MPRVTPYPPDVRRKAAVAVAVYGNSKKAATACGVPASTIRDWRANDADFQGLMAEAEIDFGEQIRANLTQIVELATKETLDRLRHGDFALISRGATVRVPVKARDAAIIAGIAFDKLRLVEGKPTRISDFRERLAHARDSLGATGQAMIATRVEPAAGGPVFPDAATQPLVGG